MELRRYVAFVGRFAWLIILVTVISTLSSAFYSWQLARPTYEATSTILVNQKPTLSTQATSMYDNVMANQALVKTYSDIMESNTILQNVIQQLHLSYTVPKLKKMISVSSSTQSEVIDVSVKSSDIRQAANIANVIVTDFQSRIVTLMAVQNVQVVDSANVPVNPIPVSPHKIENVIIAGLLGMIIGVTAAFLFEYLDDTVTTEEDVLALFDFPILGTVSKMHLRRTRQQTALTTLMLEERGG